jgi:YfiH family protein
MQNTGFVRREAEGIAYYSCTALENVPHLRHAFSTRHGGVSSMPAQALNLGSVPWDTAAHVLENRRRFLSALNIRPLSLATVSQVHSAEFHIIKTPAHQWNPRTPGDGLATAEEGVALAVQVADCFPVLLADPQTGAIAAVHAGWRGIRARILFRTIVGMQRSLGVNPAHLLAAIGPGIRSCCLEVGDEVAFAFDAEFSGARLCSPSPHNPAKYLLDLPQALHLQLAEARVPQEAVSDLGLCTRCNPAEFFSYRAEGSHSGRMMAVICRAGTGERA